jgi:anti-sigma B factor antagonist
MPDTSSARSQGAPFAIAVAVDADDAIRLCPHGEVDLSVAPELQQQIDRFLTNGRTVLLDLSELSFIDSSGLKVVVNAWHASRSNGATLRLRRGNAQIMRVFELTGLLDRLTFED